MKSFILTIGTLLISFPLVAQTPSPTGAPVFDPGNTAPIPPTINSTPTSPVTGTGLETGGFGTQVPTGTATGTGVGTPTGTGIGTGSTAPIPPGTGTTQPATGNSIMGSGWQGI